MNKYVSVGIPFEMEFDHDIVDWRPKNPNQITKMSNFVVHQEIEQEDGSIKIIGTCKLDFYFKVKREYCFEGIIYPETRTGKFTSMKSR